MDNVCAGKLFSLLPRYEVIRLMAFVAHAYSYIKQCLVEMVLTICDVLKDTKVECIKPETSQPRIQQFCVLQKCYLKWTGQNRRQKVSNGRALHLSRGA